MHNMLKKKTMVSGKVYKVISPAPRTSLPNRRNYLTKTKDSV